MPATHPPGCGPQLGPGTQWTWWGHHLPAGGGGGGEPLERRLGTLLRGGLFLLCRE